MGPVVVVVEALALVVLLDDEDEETMFVGVKRPGSVGQINGRVLGIALYFAFGSRRARYPCLPPPSLVGTFCALRFN